MSSSERTRIYSCLLTDSITEREKGKKEKEESLLGLLEEEKRNIRFKLSRLLRERERERGQEMEMILYYMRKQGYKE